MVQIIRIKNFITSISILAFAYIFYANIPYFQGYFTVEHNITFLQWSYRFTTFGVFKSFFIVYSLGLLALYLFESKPSDAKSVLFFRGIQEIFASPIKAFEKGITPENKQGILTIAVKFFFAPLMLSWLSSHISSLLTNLTHVWTYRDLLLNDFLGIFQSHLFWFLFQIILFADVFFFTLGYLIELPVLKNKIISVDPTIGGWAVALICYPPFNGAMGNILPWPSTDFPYFDNPVLLVGLNLLLLLLMGLYAWASVALNWKASNLTHRGIIAKGPYAYIRHPAYICKNLAWWVGAIPALIVGFNTGVFEAFIVILAMLAWNGIYFLRAMTEERHLRMVNGDYDLYMKKVKYRFVPGVV